MSTSKLAPPSTHAARHLGRLEPKALEYLAYQGRHAVVHGYLRRIPPAARERFLSIQTMTAFVLGGIERMRSRSASGRSPTRRECEAVSQVLDRFVARSREEESPRELFVVLMAWSEQLGHLSRHDEALDQLALAESLGIRRHPELHGRLLLRRGAWLLESGAIADAEAVLGTIGTRPYLFPDRQLVLEAVFLLARASLLAGKAAEHRRQLFGGLRRFSTDFALRRRLVRELVVGYRGVWPMSMDHTAPPIDRLLALGQAGELVLARRSPIAWLHLDWPVRMGILATLYLLNYRIPADRESWPLSSGVHAQRRAPGNGVARGRLRRRDVLVTRAMGGIGDLLMMTPAFHALREMRPQEVIHLAIPRRYFPLFEGNADVSTLDIESGVADVERFRQWFNFTDCPAARHESRTAPEVRVNRIELFARALGVPATLMRQLDRRPRYFVSEPEREFQREFWRREGLGGSPVIGLQYHSAESYRDYPHVASLARSLAHAFRVIVFSDRRLEGPARDGVITVDRLPMRQAFALAAACDVIVAPDSALMHLAGALDVRCVALCGPVDGRLRASAYPKCTVIDASAVLKCVPCWRNEVIPCRLTGLRNSACMENIAVAEVVAAVRHHLRAAGTTRP